MNTEENKNIIVGRNPVIEALKSDQEIEKILIAKGTEGSIIKITAMAKDKKIPIIYVDKPALDRSANGLVHQGVLAQVSSFAYSEVEDFIDLAKKRGEDPFLIILDGVEDPHNLGAIMRSAEVTGAHGIIITKRRSASVTEVAVRSSAGASSYIGVAKVSNLVTTIEKLKKLNVWIAACDMGGEAYYKANLKGSLAVVIGSEGFGISKLVKEKCDFVVSIPMVGQINSLNASNAAAVLMCEVRRQRDV